MAWRLLVYDPDGTHRAVLDHTDPIDRVAWSVRGDGDCLEGVVVGRGLDLRARDIVAVQVTPTPDGDVADAEIVFWGWVVTVGDLAHHDLTEWRLVGGSARLREVVNRRYRVPGGDLAAMAGAIVSRFTATGTLTSQLPPGFVFPSGERPALGFALGDRDPHMETIGETLDALASAAPGFVMEPGTPAYAYDGVTYRVGDVVPAVTWGVRAGGEKGTPVSPEARIYFRRPRGTLKLDERQDRLDVAWEPIAADAVVDSVVVIVADRPTDNAAEARASGHANSEYLPLAYELANALAQPYHAWKRVEWQSMDALAEVAWGSITSSAGIANAANAFDSSATTWAHNTTHVQPALTCEVDTAAVAVKVRWSSHVDVTLAFERTGMITYRWNLGSTGGAQKEVLLVAPRLPGLVSGASVTIVCGGHWEMQGGLPVPVDVPEDSLRIYDVRAYALNADVLDRVARSHLRPPPERVATVTVPNRIVTPQPNLELRLASGQKLTAQLATVEASVTREHGFASLLRLGQELPASLQAEKDLLARRTDTPEARETRLPLVKR